MRKSFGCFVVAAILCCGRSYGSDAGVDAVRITLTVHACNAVEAVRQVATKTQTHLLAGPEMKADVVVIDVDDVPLSELMARLASVCSARWERKGGAWVLTRTGEMERAQREQERRQRQAALKKRAALIQKELAERGDMPDDAPPLTPSKAVDLLDEYERLSTARESAELGPDYDDLRRRISKVEEQLPMERLKRQVISSLDPGVLAEVGETPVTLATNPNRLEGPLPRAAWEAFDRFLRDYAAYAQAARGRPVDSIPSEVDWDAGVQWNRGAWSRPPRLIVTVQQPWSDYFDFTICVIGPDGRLALELDDSLSLAIHDAPSKADPGLEGADLTLSELTEQMMEALGKGQAPKRPLPTVALKIVLDAEANDPLGSAATDVLLSLGKARSANLVACVPDALFILSRNLSYYKTPKLSDCIEELRESYGDVLEPKNGWLVLEPVSPSSARDARADRALLAKLGARMAQPLPLSLDEAADWATQIPLTGSTLAEIYSEIVASPKARRDFLFDHMMELRLVGLLSGAQRRYLASGQVLGGRQLTDEQATYIEWLAVVTAFAERRNVDAHLPNLLEATVPEADEGDAYYLAKWAPTEALRGGVGPSARVSVTRPTQPMVEFESDPWQILTIDMASLGRLKATLDGLTVAAEKLRDQGKDAVSADDILSLIKEVDVRTTGRPGIRTTWTIRVAFNAQFALVVTIDDDNPLVDEPIPLAEFPVAHLRAYRQAYDEERRWREEKSRDSPPPASGGARG